MTDTSNFADDDEINLLDLLHTIVDSLRMLVIGPIVAGLLALLCVNFLPKTYESTAILQAEPVIAALMQSATVLDPIAKDMGMNVQMLPDQARQQLKSQINASISRKDKLLTLTVKAQSPEGALSLAQAVLEQTFLQSKPRGTEMQSLHKQLSQSQARELEATQAAQLLGVKLRSSANANASEVVQGYAQMIGLVKASQDRQLLIKQQLRGLDASAMVQAPTLPDIHVSPRRSLIVVLSALATGFSLLLLVFVRQAFRSAEKTQESAQKINDIKTAWFKALGRQKT